jgi:hypothetical protein
LRDATDTLVIGANVTTTDIATWHASSSRS